MAWFELDASKITKLRKFRDLRVDLNWSVNEALGFLSSFWGAVVELNENGEISDWDPDYLCELTHVDTTELAARAVWDALVKNQWVIQADERFLIVDYIDMAGGYLIRKYHNSDRQKLCNIWANHGRIYGRGGGDNGGPRVVDKGDSLGEKYLGSEKEVKRNPGQSGGEFVASGEKVSPAPPSKRILKDSPPLIPQTTDPPEKIAVQKKRDRRNHEKRPEVKTLVDVFYARLEKEFKEKPTGVNFRAAAGGFFKLLKSYDAREIGRRLDNWFQSKNTFIVSNGFSPTMFFSKFNLLKDGPISNSNSVGTNAKRFIDGLATAGADKEFPGG